MNHTLKLFVFTFFLGIIFYLFSGSLISSVHAQACLPQRIINQYRCAANAGICIMYASTRIGFSCERYGLSAGDAKSRCENECGGTGGNSCGGAYCTAYAAATYQCRVESFTVGCTGPPSCSAIANILSCSSSGDSCTENSERLSYQCYVNPTAAPGATPATGSCGGVCMPAAANCGAYGKDAGSGSCSGGQLCCQDRGSYVPGCAYNPSDFPSCWDPATGRDRPGCTVCAYDEGNGCRWECTTWGSGCSGCASGLVSNASGTCVCPYCNNIQLVGVPATMTVGQVADLNRSGDFGGGSPWVYSSNPAVVAVTRNSEYPQIRAVGSGTAVISYDRTFSGVTRCSSSVTVTVPATVCTAPVVSVSSSACVPNATTNGSVTWTWPSDPAVTEYNVSVMNVSTNTVIFDAGWLPRSSFSCAAAGSTCRYTYNRPIGNYKLLVAARGTCSLSPPGESAPTILSYCAATLRVGAKRISNSAVDCTDVRSSTNALTPITLFTNPGLSPLTRIQNSATPVEWNPVVPGAYTVGTVNPPLDYNLKFACWDRSATAPLQGTGLSASVGGSEIISWQLGFVLGQAWARVVGGDAIICQNVTSPIPASLGANRHFMTSAAVGSPGIVYYGTDYDFDSDVLQKGENNVSSTDWLAQESGTLACTNNWYQFLLNKYGLTTTAADRGAGTYTQNTFPSRAQPYKVSGNMTTQGTWNYNTNGENVVIFVEGDLRINGEIRIPSRSFVAFVVQGNIIVDSSVGGNVGSSTPNVEGVYVTSGGFQTGVTNNNGSAKLIVNGIVIANSFNLQRDLDEQTANTTTPAEEFRYNPMFLLTLPNEFMDMKIKWEEVAP